VVLIHGELEHLDDLGGEILEVGVIELKLALESTIRHTAPALEHSYRLVQDLLKGHRPPSLRQCGVHKTVWEWEKSVGLVIPQMGDKRKPQIWPRVTVPCHGARRRGGGPASRIAPSDAAGPGAVATKAAAGHCPRLAVGQGP
jgi:hypothetical protein